MNEVHQPSRPGSIIFFLICLALAVGVLLWTFVLNKGKVTVSGAAPFSISVSGQKKVCTVSPCTFTLQPRVHTLEVSKDGYETFSERVTVPRGDTVQVAPTFTFIPKLTDVGEAVVAFPGAPLKSPFVKTATLQNFPKNTRTNVVSPSGAYLLATLGREMYLYEVRTKTLTKTPLSAGQLPTWAGNSIVVLVQEGSEQVLKKWNSNKFEALVSFERPFEKATMMGSPSGEHVLIGEEKDGESSYYLIDTEKKTRQRLSVPSTAKAAAFMSNAIIFEEANEEKIVDPNELELQKNSGKTIYALTLPSLKKEPIPAVDSATIIESEPGTVVYVSSEKQDRSLGSSGPSITELIEEGTRESKVERQSTVYITEMQAAEKTRTIAEVVVKAGEKIEQLTYDKEAQKFYFKKGGRLFEVALKP